MSIKKISLLIIYSMIIPSSYGAVVKGVQKEAFEQLEKVETDTKVSPNSLDNSFLITNIASYTWERWLNNFKDVNALIDFTANEEVIKIIDSHLPNNRLKFYALTILLKRAHSTALQKRELQNTKLLEDVSKEEKTIEKKIISLNEIMGKYGKAIIQPDEIREQIQNKFFHELELLGQNFYEIENLNTFKSMISLFENASKEECSLLTEESKNILPKIKKDSGFELICDIGSQIQQSVQSYSDTIKNDQFAFFDTLYNQRTAAIQAKDKTLEEKISKKFTSFLTLLYQLFSKEYKQQLEGYALTLRGSARHWNEIVDQIITKLSTSFASAVTGPSKSAILSDIATYYTLRTALEKRKVKKDLTDFYATLTTNNEQSTFTAEVKTVLNEKVPFQYRSQTSADILSILQPSTGSTPATAPTPPSSPRITPTSAAAANQAVQPGAAPQAKEEVKVQQVTVALTPVELNTLVDAIAANPKFTLTPEQQALYDRVSDYNKLAGAIKTKYYEIKAQELGKKPLPHGNKKPALDKLKADLNKIMEKLWTAMQQQLI